MNIFQRMIQVKSNSLIFIYHKIKEVGVTVLLFLFPVISSAQQPVTITITNTGNSIISRNIYGQFAEHLGRSIYDGFYKDGKIRTDITAALKKIRVPNLR
jgi:alpha-N-arabinofuranosidase